MALCGWTRATSRRRTREEKEQRDGELNQIGSSPLACDPVLPRLIESSPWSALDDLMVVERYLFALDGRQTAQVLCELFRGGGGGWSQADLNRRGSTHRPHGFTCPTNHKHLTNRPRSNITLDYHELTPCWIDPTCRSERTFRFGLSDSKRMAVDETSEYLAHASCLAGLPSLNVVPSGKPACTNQR